MVIAPLSIAQSGPGVDLSNQVEGVSLLMSDPVQDLEYARNAVTLTFDLSGVEQARLQFEALEFGDEPHAPPAGPFGDDVNFDGVAVSADGVNWYEIQGLRGLRSDRYTAFDLDLDALVATAGLSYNGAFRIRFCQYDDNPAPMDGVSIKGIELVGEGRPPILHLTLDDNAATPALVDAGTGHHDQTFVDPGGDANTSAHSVAGRVGTALRFDGVDDRIVLSEACHRAYLGANRDFSIAFWWKANSPTAAGSYVVGNRMAAGNFIYMYTSSGHVFQLYRFDTGVVREVGKVWQNAVDANWHHYVYWRKGTVLRVYRDGVLGSSGDHPDNSLSLAAPDSFLYIGTNTYGGQASPGFADDFRLYDRALLESEIQELAAHA